MLMEGLPAKDAGQAICVNEETADFHVNKMYSHVHFRVIKVDWFTYF